MNGFSPGPVLGPGRASARRSGTALGRAPTARRRTCRTGTSACSRSTSPTVTNPTMLLARTTVRGRAEDGDAHSMTPYRTVRRPEASILQNDEDFDAQLAGGDPLRPQAAKRRWPTESPGGPPLWLERKPPHLRAASSMAANQGCVVCRLPGGTAGRDRGRLHALPVLRSGRRRRAALRAAGPGVGGGGRRRCMAVVHDFVVDGRPARSGSTSAEVDIPVLFTDHATAQGMVAAGRATLVASEALPGASCGSSTRRTGSAGRRRSTTSTGRPQRCRRRPGEWSDPQHRGRREPRVQSPGTRPGSSRSTSAPLDKRKPR